MQFPLDFVHARLGAPYRAAGERLYLTVMLYFLAIFCSPLALLFAGRPISALFNLLLYVLSIVLWASIILYHAGFLMWALAFLHAAFAIHDSREQRRMRRIIAATRLD